MKNNKTPQVSVIIPCYNHGEYIAEAVDSVLAQTFQDFEIIITDDASNDGITPAQIKAVAKKDKRIRVCTHKENRGLPGTRNTAIEAGKGKYILPLDADDKIAETYLEKTVRHLEKTKADIVCTHYQRFGEINSVVRIKKNLQEMLPIQNRISCCSLYKKSVWREVGGYNDNMRGGLEDWDFWLGCLEKGKKFSLFDEILFYYRQRRGSMLDDSEKISHELIRQIKKNHPSLYQWHNYYFSKIFIVVVLKTFLRFLLDLRWSPHKKHIRVLGIKIFYKEG